jgi:type I restriction enzyme M protein
MAIKKSELYSSLWASCDELRGSMDASQYKDYVLVMLFVKYISDRYANVPYAPIKIPQGATFQDMVALKNNPNIGDLINKQIIGPIAEANKLSEMPDFANPDKLGSGPDMVKKLTNLIAIFENPALDFKSNRAEGDDILGDAYEYLMRHFATESGKSKGQFYTPAEVSRVMAKIIGINAANTTSETSVYDPACGSGSLLLKVADEAEKAISVFGQENDSATAGLARMNMILHNNPTAVIKQGNTLSNPLFLDSNSRLKTFDFVVANPPFSFKSWSNGVNIAAEQEEGGRFYGYGVPPAKNGDYAFLLHILKSLKSKGKAAVILPHGVLFRGNAEAEIRKNLIRSSVIKGIIGLPANLFYGTGIPACLIILDKENRESRKGIFMMDAGKGFVKDGNKNRLREQDIHKIVDVFNKQVEVPKYSRMVSLAEIEEKEFNLNIPRYIDSTEPEDIQNIEAHLLGDIPTADIEALQGYWNVYPSLRNHLFENSNRPGFTKLKIAKEEIKQSIFNHPEFVAYSNKVNEVFAAWRDKNIPKCKAINSDTLPKKFGHSLSEDLLSAFSNLELIDKYDVYQHFMSYWMEVMQDDCYIITGIGWVEGARCRELIPVKDKNNKTVWPEDADIIIGNRRYKSDLIPRALLIQHYFTAEQTAIEELEASRDALAAQLEELEEEHSAEEGYFTDFDKVNKAIVAKRLKEIQAEKKKPVIQEMMLAAEPEAEYGEAAVLEQYLQWTDKLADANKKLKEAKATLDNALLAKYAAITESEIKQLVVEDKWMTSIEHTVKNEMQRISQRLAQRIKELAERYESTLPAMLNEVKQLEEKVNAHLVKMGFTWN